MWTPEDNLRKYEEIKNTVFFDMFKPFYSQDDKALPQESRDSAAPSEERSTTDPLEKSPTKGPLENEATMRPFEKRTTLKPLEAESSPRNNVQRNMLEWEQRRLKPFSMFQPGKTLNYIEEPPIETTVNFSRPVHFELPENNHKLDFEPPSSDPPPFSSAAKVIGGTVGGFLTLVMISVTVATLLDRKNPTRRSILRGARSYGSGTVFRTDTRAADQEMLIDWIPPDGGEPGGASNADLPPSYNECAPFGINNPLADEPPPYCHPEPSQPSAPPQYSPRHIGIIVNELQAYSADVTPEMLQII